MGPFEARSFIEPDPAGVGDPADPGRRIIVEHDQPLQSDPALELGGERTVEHDQLHRVRERDLPRVRRGRAVSPPRRDVDVGIRPVVSPSATAEQQGESGAGGLEGADDPVEQRRVDRRRIDVVRAGAVATHVRSVRDRSGRVAPTIGRMAVIMDGNALRDDIVAELRTTIEAAGSPHVCLATVLVGDDRPSQVYVRNKQRKAAEAGMASRHVELPGTIGQAELEATVAELAADPEVHGILVQLPLPDGLDAEAVLDLIPPEKDVDGLTERSMGRLVRGRDGLVPCTPLGVMRLLERYEVPTSGRRAVIVGRSTLVGLPLALLLARKGVDATVTLAHSRTAELAAVCREADIVVGAAGQARMITAEHVKPGAAVIDVGISRTEAGLVGDVDFDPVAEIAGWITPMPGGTGPMTIACLLENTLAAARLQGAFPA